ncbi:MAG: hypothetical protein IJU98_01015 [Synergistaceae bacterium]|nr:hypothetical protein [Synergistaceae bacterium]
MSFSRRILLLTLALGCLAPAFSVHAKVYVAEPLLVEQPSYAGMTFYVYRPYNMPKGWYVTFDGFPVRKNDDGVWVYGTSSGPNLTATNYIVGSVVPSLAGITPWVQPAQISSFRNLPNAGALTARQPALPESRLAGGQTTSTWIPDWTYNPRFMAIGNWKGSVDRIGILHNPNVPIAWKGDSPKVIYVWTGKGWHQLMPRENEPAMSAIRREMYSLTRIVKCNQLVWYEEDVPVLAQQSTAWGYYWMGEISPSR